MNSFTSAFQFEIRYTHILNFSEEARKLLAPFVRLATRIKIENANTVEERIVFNFDEEDYLIIASWDRIFIKGQGDLRKFIKKNSPFEIPFLTIYEKIKSLEEFGTIKNVLFASNFIKEIDITENNLLGAFMNKTLKEEFYKILSDNTDVAITLERKHIGNEKTINVGPYFGIEELTKRVMPPVNIDSLTDVDYHGIMVEYKDFQHKSEINFNDFIDMVNESFTIVDDIWKRF